MFLGENICRDIYKKYIYMPQYEFIVAIRLWLGISLFPAANSLNALRHVCGQAIDCFGEHLHGCSYDSTLVKRHNARCDILWHTLLVNNKSARREQNNSANLYSCPGDIYMQTFLMGDLHFLMSLSVIHCNQLSSLQQLSQLGLPLPR